jgi:cell division protein FtsL
MVGKTMREIQELDHFGRRSQKTQATPTVASVEARIRAAREQVVELEAQLADLQEQQRIREAAETQRLADEAALTKVERLSKELRAKLGK